LGALTALLIGLTLVAAVDPSAGDRAQTSKPPTVSVFAEPYPDPDVIAKHFSTELARLAREQQLASPADLALQGEEAKHCVVETTADPGQPLRPEEIYRRVRRSVVVVGGIGNRRKDRGRRAYCAAGFVLHPDGIIATNAHVLVSFKEMKALGAMTCDGRVFPVQKVLAADKHGDVAVLKIDARNLTPLPIATDVPVGATVYCLSHPVLNEAKTENAFFAFTQGIVSGKYRLRIAGDVPVEVLTVTTDYAVGSSGGPIVNEHGAAVGMTCQTLPISHDEEQGDLQMVWKFSRPATTLLALLKDAHGQPKP
jgi:S1-C subfamily serine protease